MTTDAVLTAADRIEAWHRMRYPRDAGEHVTAAALLGVLTPQLEGEIRTWWKHGCPPLGRDGAHLPEATHPGAARRSPSLAPPATPRTGARRRLSAGLSLP
jgi:hypothetical protein